MLIQNEFYTTTGLVEFILDKFPETRSNDTNLYFQCCRTLGATTLEEAEELNLSIVSVHKIRQKIQNKELRFRPSDEVIQYRKEKEEIMKQLI